MAIEHVLAVVAVSDIDRSEQWYTALFGRPADNNPMPSLVEWQKWLAKNAGEGSTGASRAEAASTIAKYLADPKSVKLRSLPTIPPGAPI